MDTKRIASHGVHPLALAELELGIEALSFFLVHVSASRGMHDKLFLDVIAPLLYGLRPLQLQSRPRAYSEAVEPYILKKTNIVANVLRDYLYSVALRERTIEDASRIAYGTGVNSGDALICLTSARGHVGDFLLIVHLLLRAGQSFSDPDAKKYVVPDSEPVPKK